MLQFGIFSSHIPYLVIGMLYMAYLGMFSFKKITKGELVHANEKVISVKKQSNSVASQNCAYYGDFVNRKVFHHVYASNCEFLKFPYKIFDPLDGYYIAQKTRPPPALFV